MTYLVSVLLIVVAITLLLHGFAYFFVGKALPVETSEILHGSDKVDVDYTPWLQFSPREQTPKAGLIFHPGGYVDPEAYSQIMAFLAEQGVLVVVVAGPQRTPIADRFAADRVLAAYPQIQSWFIGGHSQGGAVANLYLRDRWQDTPIKGLIYLGYFSGDRHSLAHINIPVLTIYGTRDGHASKFAPRHHNLPIDRRIVCIDGGNHGQFGAYGLHFGDQTSEISRCTQQVVARQSIIDFIEEILAR